MAKARKPGGLQAVIADNVRRLRKARGISQEALAETCGYHRTYVGMIERGERRVRFAPKSGNPGPFMRQCAMASRVSRKKPATVIGAKAFAAITAVEGLKLSDASRRRVDRLKASGLPGEERRAEILRAYRSGARNK